MLAQRGGRLKNDIKNIFKDIVRMRIEEEIITGEEIFVDHTKFEANANRHRIVWKKTVDKSIKLIDEELELLAEKIERIQQRDEKEEHVPDYEKRKRMKRLAARNSDDDER